MFLNQSACVLEGSLVTYKYNTFGWDCQAHVSKGTLQKQYVTHSMDIWSLYPPSHPLNG